jgi:hypothetical protein
MPFHIALYARHSQARPGPGGTLVVPPDAPAELLPITFERAAEELARWPRLFFEPDGSFVWVAATGTSPRWQVDGQLWDAGAGLADVELHGDCPAEAFDQLAGLLGGADGLMVLSVESGVLCELSSFRASLALTSGAANTAGSSASKLL